MDTMKHERHSELRLLCLTSGGGRTPLALALKLVLSGCRHSMQLHCCTKGAHRTACLRNFPHL